VSADDDPARLLPGSEVASYVVVSTLGVGGSGTVYKARKKDSETLVALKVMNDEHKGDDSERQRFEREAEVVKRLAHPHVVGLLDYGVDPLPYLVFPLLEGRTLEQRIAKEGALGWGLSGKFSEQVLSALEVAHRMGIAHRDIKPANLFLCLENGVETIQILDFGTAKIVGDKKQEMDVTRAGLLVGTPRYMAPEQVRMEELTPAADVYAFGLVMAEMMLGRPLVEGKSEFDIFVAQGSDNPHVLPEQILASPFATVIERAVAKPFEVRYRFASQMLADVRAVLARFGAGHAHAGEADMEATQFIVAPEPVLPNENAMKLRKAFNAIADKNAAAQPSKAPPPAPPPPGPPPPTVDFDGPPSVAPWSPDPIPSPVASIPVPGVVQPIGEPPSSFRPIHPGTMQQPAAYPQQMQQQQQIAASVESQSWSAQHAVQQQPQQRVESASWSGQHQVAPNGYLQPTTMRMSSPVPPPNAQWPQQDPRYAYGAQPYPQAAPPGAYGPPQQPAAFSHRVAVVPRRSSSSGVVLFFVALVFFIAGGAALALYLRPH
jgi:serine/threonine protein kinase